MEILTAKQMCIKLQVSRETFRKTWKRFPHIFAGEAMLPIPEEDCVHHSAHDPPAGPVVEPPAPGRKGFVRVAPDQRV